MFKIHDIGERGDEESNSRKHIACALQHQRIQPTLFELDAREQVEVDRCEAAPKASASASSPETSTMRSLSIIPSLSASSANERLNFARIQPSTFSARSCCAFQLLCPWRRPLRRPLCRFHSVKRLGTATSTATYAKFGSHRLYCYLGANHGSVVGSVGVAGICGSAGGPASTSAGGCVSFTWRVGSVILRYRSTIP